MTHYTAQFEGHTISRRSDRTYSHAWIVTVGDKIVDKGFSGSAELAHKAAAATHPKDISAKEKARCRAYHIRFAKSEGMTVDEWYALVTKQTASRIAKRKVQVAPVTAS